MLDGYREELQKLVAAGARPPGCIFLVTQGRASILHEPAPCKIWKNVPIDSRCSENEHSNLEVDDDCLTKEDTDEHSAKGVREAEKKCKKHHSRMQE